MLLTSLISHNCSSRVIMRKIVNYSILHNITSSIYIFSSNQTWSIEFSILHIFFHAINFSPSSDCYASHFSLYSSTRSFSLLLLFFCSTNLQIHDIVRECTYRDLSMLSMHSPSFCKTLEEIQRNLFRDFQTHSTVDSLENRKIINIKRSFVLCVFFAVWKCEHKMRLCRWLSKDFIWQLTISYFHVEMRAKRGMLSFIRLSSGQLCINITFRVVFVPLSIDPHNPQVVSMLSELSFLSSSLELSIKKCTNSSNSLASYDVTGSLSTN